MRKDTDPQGRDDDGPAPVQDGTKGGERRSMERRFLMVISISSDHCNIRPIPFARCWRLWQGPANYRQRAGGCMAGVIDCAPPPEHGEKKKPGCRSQRPQRRFLSGRAVADRLETGGALPCKRGSFPWEKTRASFRKRKPRGPPSLVLKELRRGNNVLPWQDLGLTDSSRRSHGHKMARIKGIPREFSVRIRAGRLLRSSSRSGLKVFRPSSRKLPTFHDSISTLVPFLANKSAAVLVFKRRIGPLPGAVR